MITVEERPMASCPSCTKPIYNRRKNRCEFCGTQLPAILLLGEAQKRELVRISQAEKVRHAEWKRDLDRHTDHSDGSGSGLSYWIQPADPSWHHHGRRTEWPHAAHPPHR